MISHSMRVQEFEVFVHLGCSADERRDPQPVRFQIDLSYAEPVKGAQTDQLADATDYVQITNLVKESAQIKPYQLIEHLSAEAFEVLMSYLRLNSFKGRVRLQVQKVRVPVDGLFGGVVFACETVI